MVYYYYYFAILYTYSGKVLGIIQSSHVGGGLKAGSSSVAAKVNTDLRRVLAIVAERRK